MTILMECVILYILLTAAAAVSLKGPLYGVDNWPPAIQQRAGDIRYVKEHFPDAELVKLENMRHASMASLHPGEMAERLHLLAAANTQKIRMR